MKPISIQSQTIKCRNCRFQLITNADDLIFHLSNDMHSQVPCGLYYINPFVAWIPIEEYVMQGKIDCPGCNGKLMID